MKYVVLHNNTKAHEVQIDAETILVDSEQTPIDLVQIKPQLYHAILNHQSYTIEVAKIDIQAKQVKLKINDAEYSFQLQDKLDLLLEQMGIGKSSSDKLDDIKAPMPGLVLKVLVEVGQEVKKGDNILILEAMKMENIIKASGSGTIKNILIAPKQAVEKNQLLIEIE